VAVTVQALPESTERITVILLALASTYKSAIDRDFLVIVTDIFKPSLDSLISNRNPQQFDLLISASFQERDDPLLS